MKPFHEIANKIIWTVGAEGHVVGYYDRVEDAVIEMPLADFLASDIPEHRARYIKREEVVVWDRRK